MFFFKLNKINPRPLQRLDQGQVQDQDQDQNQDQVQEIG